MPAGTDGVLEDAITPPGDATPRDIFVARIEGRGAMQVLREDVVEVKPGG